MFTEEKRQQTLLPKGDHTKDTHFLSSFRSCHLRDKKIYFKGKRVLTRVGHNLQNMKASQTIISGLLLVLSLCCHQTEKTVAFVLPFSGSSNAANRLSFLSKAKCTVHSSSSTTQKHSSSFYDMEDDDDEDDEDDFIDFDSLGDWRDFRRNLARTIPTFEEGTESTKPVVKISSVSKENEEVLSSQNEELAEEYIKGVWAHEVATVSVLVLTGELRKPLVFVVFLRWNDSSGVQEVCPLLLHKLYLFYLPSTNGAVTIQQSRNRAALLSECLWR